MSTNAVQTAVPIPIHTWVDKAGKVLVVKCVDREGRASAQYGSFQHPVIVGESVTAPDWNPVAECGGGIHGWAWGLNIGEGKDPDYLGLWLVYSVDPLNLVDVSGKVKFKTGDLVYVGPWAGALSFTLSGRTEYVIKNSSGSASNSGYRGSASNSGYRGSASNSGDSGSASNSGDSGSASNSGDSGSASNSGYRGSASNSGYRGSASNSGYGGSASNSGYGGSAESIPNGTAAIVTGIFGKAKGPDYGCIALAWWNEKAKRVEMRCALTGLGGTLKANQWYGLDDNGNFKEAL